MQDAESYANGIKRLDTILNGTVTGYRYTVNEDVGAQYISTIKRKYELLFENAEIYTGMAYWLSSSGVNVDSDCAYFSLGTVYEEGETGLVDLNMYTFDSDGKFRDFGFGVRPVISLESGIKAIDVPKIQDQTNPSWGGIIEEN